jgi:phosphopantothenoylcysteine decarboxylase / phosphopantothenate---cysteine ligase
MGIALADAAAYAGASVDLVLGPVDIKPSNPAVNVINVVTAEEMASVCIGLFPVCDVAILSAAVADFTPETFSDNKIKSGKEDFVLKLKPTRDIALSLGKIKNKKQLLVGFALETENELDNAFSKLKRKKLDIIVLNSLREKGAGFGFDTNQITIIDHNNNIDKFELKSKEDVANDILDKIVSILLKIF